MVAIRILVVGYQGAGKTAMLQSLNCRITDDLTEYAVDFDTNEDLQLSFLCSESCDSRITDPKYAGYIVMFDVTKVVSYKYAREILRTLASRCVDKKTTILVANKIDLKSQRSVHNIAAGKEFGVSVFEISSTASINENNKKAFLSLGRYLLQRPSLVFIDAVPIPMAAPNDPVALLSEAVPIPIMASVSGNSVAGSPSLAGLESPAQGKLTQRRRKPKTLRINGEEQEIVDSVNNQKPSCCFY